MSDLVLVVEDEQKIADLLVKYLENVGYQTHWIADGELVEPWVIENSPSLILLDLMLPNKDGLEICKALRQFTQLPIIMLTARVEEIDRLLGLELGADDYICKPFSPREVIARAKAVLRRSQVSSTLPSSTSTTEPSITLNRNHLSAHVQGNEIILTKVEFELLHTLQSQSGRIFSRQSLMDHVYSDNRIVSDRTIDSHIKKLRKKLAEHITQEVIHSVYSVGYRYDLTPTT